MACIAKRRGRYVLDFYDNHGKRRWKTLPEGSTKADAREVLIDIEDKVRKRIYLPPKRIPTFTEFAGLWLELKKPNIRHSTYKQYKGHVKNHLKPFFGEMKIDHISYNEVEKYIVKSLNDGISIPTLRKILINLGAIMTYAVRKRYRDYNPVRDIEKPKGQSNNYEEKLKVLAPSEIKILLESAPDFKHETLFMVAVTTGLRQGELLGLKWFDIDWFSRQIHIKRTYNHFNFYEPKTRCSKRKVDIPPQTIKQLKKWKLACPSNDLDLIFPNGDGGPMSAWNMYNRKWIPALKKAGLKIRFHDLRHTYASIQIDLGANIKYVQNQMGHSTDDVISYISINIEL